MPASHIRLTMASCSDGVQPQPRFRTREFVGFTGQVADHSELRAVGFSPSGRTLAVATSSDLSLWTRRTGQGRDGGGGA